jgi:hypothetical protein
MYCDSKLEAKKLKDYMILHFNNMTEAKELMDYAIMKKKIKTAAWFYHMLMRFCRDVLGADDLYFPSNKQFLEESGSDHIDNNLPLFLNRGLMAMGTFSIFNVTAGKFKRTIDSWRYEDLSKLEIGPREQHFRDLPCFSLDRVICTLGTEHVPYAVFVDIAIIKGHQGVLKKDTVGFQFAKQVNNIVYMERCYEYHHNAVMHLEDINKRWLE